MKTLQSPKARRFSLRALTPALLLPRAEAPVSPSPDQSPAASERRRITPRSPAALAAPQPRSPLYVDKGADSDDELPTADARVDAYVADHRGSTTAWESPRPAPPRPAVVDLEPEAKRALANAVALVWQRRKLKALYESLEGGSLARNAAPKPSGSDTFCGVGWQFVLLEKVGRGTAAAIHVDIPRSRALALASLRPSSVSAE